MNPPASRLMDARKKMLSGSRLPVVLGLLGAAVLAIGAYAPLIHIPIVGSVSYLHHPVYFTSCNLGELVILAASGSSIVFVLLKRFKTLWLTGAAALIQLAATVTMFRHTVATVVARADKPDLVDPMLMWAGAALERARFEWGIALVACGAVMILAAAAWGTRGAGMDP
jgi:hypothetical protein